MSEGQLHGGPRLGPTSSDNHSQGLGDQNQLLFKTSSLAILRAKRSSLPTTKNDTYIAGARRVMDFMFNLWQTNRLCDVVLTSSENELWAHKIAVGAHSSYLAEKFFDQPAGTICHINLSRFAPDILRTILTFVYTTDLELTMENIEPVLDCALEMGMDILVMACKDYICSCDVDTVLSFHTIAEKYGLTDLRAPILAIIADNFSYICKTNEYLEADYNFIKKLANEDMLGLSSELDLFLAIVDWIEYDRPTRLQFAPDLIGSVRMHLMTPEILVTRVENVRFIFNIPKCHGQLYNAFKYHSLNLSCSALANDFSKQTPRGNNVLPTLQSESGPTYKQQISVYLDGNTPQTSQQWNISMVPSNSERLVSSSRGIKAQYPHSSADNFRSSLVVVAVGGIDLQSLSSDIPGKGVYCLDASFGSWEQLTQMQHYTHHHGVASIGSSIYVIGGAIYNPEKPDEIGVATDMVHAYDVISAQWRRLADMKESRAYHAVASHNGVIYAIGGENQNKTVLDSIERYDVDKDQWTLMARLHRGPKIGMCAAICKNLLYIVGGYNKERTDSHVLDDVECFDLAKQRWKAKRHLPLPRCHANLLTAGGGMYLIGGRTKLGGSPSAITSLTSVMVYDEATDTWRKVTDLRVARHDAGCISIGSKIYVVGGMVTPSPFCLSSVECFDVNTGRWEENTMNLPFKASGLACCALETTF